MFVSIWLRTGFVDYLSSKRWDIKKLRSRITEIFRQKREVRWAVRPEIEIQETEGPKSETREFEWVSPLAYITSHAFNHSLALRALRVSEMEEGKLICLLLPKLLEGLPRSIQLDINGSCKSQGSLEGLEKGREINREKESVRRESRSKAKITNRDDRGNTETVESNAMLWGAPSDPGRLYLVHSEDNPLDGKIN